VDNLTGGTTRIRSVERGIGRIAAVCCTVMEIS